MRPAGGLVGLPVRVAGLRSGSVEEVVLGADLSVVLGFVVETRAERRCFLPWVASSLDGDTLVASSGIAMLGEVELAYYLESGVGLSLVRGVTVAAADDVVADVLVGDDGRVRALEVACTAGTRTVPLDETRVRWSAGRLLEVALAGGVGAAVSAGGLAVAAAPS